MINLTIIVTVFNLENYIEDCMDSIVRQLDSTIELIVINDGSTDTSGLLLEKYISQNIRVINTSNNGVSSARNLGVNIAQGKYISFVDGDDEILPNYIECFKRNLLFDNLNDLINFRIKVKTKENEFIPLETLKISDSQLSIDDYLKLYGFTVVPTCFFYNIEFLKSNSLFFKEGIRYEDTYFFIELFNVVSSIKVISDVLYLYKIRAGSFTQSKKTEVNAKSLLMIIKLLVSIVPNKLPNKIVQEQLFWHIISFLKVLNSNKPLAKSYLKKLRKIIKNIEVFDQDWIGVKFYKTIYNYSPSLLFKLFQYKILK